MRFKAQLKDLAALVQMLQSLEKFGSQCYVMLCEESIELMILDDLSSGSKVFARSPTDSMFENMVIESRSGNRILLLAHIDNLLRALRVAERADLVVVRLSKDQGHPFLSFDIRLPSMVCEQHVPVAIQHSRSFDMCNRPEFEMKPNKPMVKFQLPEIRTLRAIVDRMAGVSDRISLEADPVEDQVILSVRSDLCEIRTFFNDLVTPPHLLVRQARRRRLREAQAQGSAAMADDNDEDPEGEPSEQELIAARRPAVIQLKIKRLQHVLSCHVLQAILHNAYIVPEVVFVVLCRLPDDRGAVHYYVPVLNE